MARPETLLAQGPRFLFFKNQNNQTSKSFDIESLTGYHKKRDNNVGKSNLAIKIFGGVILGGLILVFIWFLFYNNEKRVNTKKETMPQVEIILPQPDKTGQTSLEEALSKRRSVRNYKDEPLNLKEISQILWAAQGITAPEFGGRTTPSAGALYPLEVYLVVKNANEIKAGVYQYRPASHKLTEVLPGDISSQLARAALGQMFIAEAPVNLVFSGVFSRTTSKYGDRGIQYVYMEVGHAAQNVYLQAQSLGLATVVVGAFDDEEVKRMLNMSEEETPLYIMPVGKVMF